MAAGYSSTPLYKKLGIKKDFKVKLLNPPVNYPELIGEIAGKITVENRAIKDLDLIHLFTNSATELEEVLPQLKKLIKKDGTIWVSWYKKSSGKATDITEENIRETALAIGLVDVKVCAVDEEWSGLKLVYRLKDR